MLNQAPVDLTWLKNLSEIVKNFAEGLGLLGAVFVLFKWLAARRDRSTEVLFQLEDRFEQPDLRRARTMVESDLHYERIRRRLLTEALPADDVEDSPKAVRLTPTTGASELEPLDSLLRFFVLLLGIRKARQVSDASLRACYRYWLAHWFSPCRRELRVYVENLFPTLHRWLIADSSKWRQWFGRSFFRPGDFGWATSRAPDPERLRRALRGKVLVITGAGISAESGVPTYRGPAGLWRSRRAEDLATRKAFSTHPETVWEWYRYRRAGVRRAQPSIGHRLLVEMANCASEYLVLTQNVDDLHQRAAEPVSARFVESHLLSLHGELLLTRCSSAACDYQDHLDHADQAVPRCPRCHSPLRPGVVWFDEDYEAGRKERIESFISEGPCDLVLVIGTSARFVDVVDWALRAAGRTGLLIEINPEDTNLTVAADWHLRTGSAAGLQTMLRRGGQDSNLRGSPTAPGRVALRGNTTKGMSATLL